MPDNILPKTTELPFTAEEERGSHPLLRRLVHGIEHMTQRVEQLFAWQVEQALKVPVDWYTRGGNEAFAFPSPDGQTAVELSGGLRNREALVISNTGANAVLIGRSAREAQQRGFTIQPGGTVTLKTRNAVWAYCASTSSVEILETQYGVETL